MFKSLKAKIHHKRSKSSSRMTDSEDERSRDAPQTENSQTLITAAQVSLPEDHDRKEGVQEDGDAEKQSKRAMFGEYLQEGWSKSKELSNEQFLKGKLALQQSLGLGAKPNAIPAGEARVDADLRLVEIGWHPVAGMGGKWLAEKSGIGKKITASIGKYPDPTQHWAVLVGEYAHELWMDEELNVIYINEKINREEWQTFEVGQTRFTDEACRQAGEMVIHNMRKARPAYNVISNNCQNYAVSMLDAIQIGAHREFATSFAVYQAATGDGTIKDLFEDKHPEEQKTDIEQVDEGKPEFKRTDTVQNAQIVMEENTTKLDDHGAR